MESSLKEYEKYMLTTENINRIPKLQMQMQKQKQNLSSNTKTINPTTNSKTKVVASRHIPKTNNLVQQTDKMFWCFFIILNGNIEYELDHSFKKEKEFKIGSIEKLRKIKSELKAIKLRLNEIEDELLNQKKISIKSLVALCLLYKINLIYVWNRKYFEIINDADKDVNIIINDGTNTTIVESKEKLNYYRENYWCITNIDKPLKALTSYSKDELFLIIQKLEIKDVTDKSTKKAMYEKILEKI